MWRQHTVASFLLAWVVLENARSVTNLVTWPAFAAFILVMLAVALAARSWPIIHLALLFALTTVVGPWVPVGVLHVPAVGLALWFAVSVLLLVPFSHGRATLGWLRLGEVDRVSAALLIVTAVVAGVALIVWARWTDELGAAVKMMAGVSHLPTWFVGLVGIPLFALLNAFSEEVVYRGIVQEALAQTMGARPAFVIAAQASVFAAAHFLVGFPNGVVGYLMVFVWGCVLGYLRRRTAGLLAPYVVHVAADLVIVYYVFSLV
ncbi:type II CAAX prenyl endopeptidase Rce1 family protein [Myxococcota bacterium]